MLISSHGSLPIDIEGLKWFYYLKSIGSGEGKETRRVGTAERVGRVRRFEPIAARAASFPSFGKKSNLSEGLSRLSIWNLLTCHAIQTLRWMSTGNLTSINIFPSFSFGDLFWCLEINSLLVFFCPIVCMEVLPVSMPSFYPDQMKPQNSDFCAGCGSSMNTLCLLSGVFFY